VQITTKFLNKAPLRPFQGLTIPKPVKRAPPLEKNSCEKNKAFPIPELPNFKFPLIIPLYPLIP